MHFPSILTIPLFLASFAHGLVLDKRVARTTSPSGCLVVQQTNTASGQYASFSAAVAALGSTKTVKCIFLNPGTYKEQVRINYGGNLTIYGFTSDTSNYKGNQATIVSSQSSAQAGNLDASSAVNFVSSNIKVYNVNFSNNFGTASQAVAVTTNGNYQSFYGCQFLGNQDTLYAKAGLQYFKSCYIEGTVDFIFGNAAAWFGACTITVKRSGGVITANSRTLATDTAWYVFDKCDVVAAAGLKIAGTVFLGRPWRVMARVMFQNSVLSDIVAAAGWTTMAENATPVFEEFGNSGAGSDISKRKYITAATAGVTKKQLWGGDYNSWIDAAY